MKISRRKFMGSTAAAAAASPLLFNASASAQLAADDIDWGMGFPDGATLLNRNENPIGPSQRAIEAAKVGVEKSFRYADSILIKSLLAEHHDIEEDYILVGAGSGELLNIAPMITMSEPDHNMVATWESYRAVPGRVERLGHKVKWVHLLEEEKYEYNVDRLLAAVDENTRLLFMVTPNNPTGTILSFDDMHKLADGLPDHVLLIVDGAYTDFQDVDKDGIDLIKGGHKNILVTRTFSKIYAMAGLRCGYGIGHPDVMKKISRFGCGPTSTNMAGFGAMAASVGDTDHVKKSRDFVSRARAYYSSECDKLGLSYMAGPPNFFLAETGEYTDAIAAELRAQKIFVRPGAEWGMPNHTRISYGLDHENQTFFAALKEILGA
ncbi:MAG: aminotransferase class I/II-fold pyridoxal phosphate-dependent enzyme [Kordiimonadaceae bacterium]|nr:aminotransferase class I/II-fold pyridoxal phosphate-dependent enzyme [Kordiimonadaceae bacterium]MBT6330740.1 aminotransferase class I/II-fold pyridoxal phosphate-dependent enzyme [Kordiimonadaceae bacterium]